MALTQYITDTQLMVHDSNGVFQTQQNYINWINEARSWIAGKAMCVRELAIQATVLSQETYPLPTSATAGVGQALGVISIAVPEGGGNLKPVLDWMPWTMFQARCRAFSNTTTGYPAVWAQAGDYSSAKVYMYPIPQSAYNAEWDCYFNVLPLTSDISPEALPYPFTTGVKYYAAYLAYLNAQRMEDAQGMLQLFANQMVQARSILSNMALPSAYRG